MNIKLLNKKLFDKFCGRIYAEDIDGSTILSGELDSYQEIIEACQMSVSKGRHVVNDIKFLGYEEKKMRVPKFSDDTLEGKNCDVLIIGGGISGASIFRELTKWNLDVLLVDKESDLALHASGRNDGEVHPGMDLKLGLFKQKYVLLGNEMYDKICDELDVPFKRVGQIVGLMKRSQWLPVKAYVFEKRVHCKVPATTVIGKKKILELEPNLKNGFKYGIYSKTAGSVSPYLLTIAYAENGVQNGGTVSLDTAVLGMNVENGKILSVKTNRGEIFPRLVINASGVFAEDIAKMAEDRFYSIHPRRGTNSILDKKANWQLNGISSILVLGEKGHTKGGGMVRTVDDNILVGPDAVEIPEKEDFATYPESIDKVFTKQKLTSNNLEKKDIITYFTGIRAATFEEDFVIERGRKTSNLIHVAGIQSPGLTTAPAVAIYVEKLAIDILSNKGKVERNLNYDPRRKGIVNVKELSDEKRNELIKNNTDYGVIVCRCEEISKGEIIDALKSSICVPTIDGIKKRLRPGMGRCQGGFCSPLISKIIADYFNLQISEVVKSSKESVVSFGHTKGGDNEKL